MTTAIALIQAEQRRINEVGERLAGIKGITEVYSVGGKFDFVAIMRLPDNDALAELVTEKVTQIEGIIKTETMVAFRAFSKYDLAAIFEID
ncbi:MAG: Lrp/AsnC family transcriptional regulator [Mangrovibacterium sp.]|jgi:DNA-binding Lrp family transcriptional regulator